MFESSTNFLELGRIHNLVVQTKVTLDLSSPPCLGTQGLRLTLYSVHKRMSHAFGRIFTFYI